MLDEIHAAGGLMMVIYTGEGWDSGDAWSYIGSHIPHTNYVTATGLPWMLALPNTFVLDLATLRVIAKDPTESSITPAEIVAAVEGNNG